MYEMTIPFVAAEDLSGRQYQAVTIQDRKLANNGQEATGILQNKPASGEHGTLVVLGRSLARAGAALSAMGRFSVTTSGYLAVPASNSFICGFALESITSGSLGEVFMLPSGHYQVSSIIG